MIGIPVLPNGDPVRKTFVFAYNFQQFGYWCRFSRVNPRSRNVVFLHDTHQLRGLNDFDLVYTGTDDGWSYTSGSVHNRMKIHHDIQRLHSLGCIKNVYSQWESADIEPNVID